MPAEGAGRRLLDSLENQQGDPSSNQNKALNGSNFITLGKISEQKKIEIIKLGFQLQAISGRENIFEEVF